jgi:hypothetical protein
VSIHKRIFKKKLFTAEPQSTRRYIFPIAAERAVIGKPSAAYAAETTKAINSLIARSDTDILLPEGLCHFAFRVLRPGGSGAYPSGSAKSKKEKPKTLRSLRLE